jgi:hypothetical protein
MARKEKTEKPTAKREIVRVYLSLSDNYSSDASRRSQSQRQTEKRTRQTRDGGRERDSDEKKT